MSAQTSKLIKLFAVKISITTLASDLVVILEEVV